MQIRKATPDKLDEVCQFYQTICAQQQDDAYGADWHWGVYPGRALLADRIKRAMVVEGIVDSRVTSIGVLTAGEDPNYRQVKWSVPAKDEQIVILHLFAVDQAFRGRGIAKQMLQGLFQFAKKRGYAVMHLDVMKENVPAERTYVKSGFRFAGEVVIHYDDIGDTTAQMYERVL